jgi:hypothetical protein
MQRSNTNQGSARRMNERWFIAVMYLIILFLLSLLTISRGAAQSQQQQRSRDTGDETKSEIRPLSLSPTPPTLPPTASNTGNGAITTPNENSQQDRYQTKLHSSRWDHLSTFLTALATAIIAYFAWVTWNVYEEQLRVSKINERAWIVPVIGVITPTPNPKLFQIQVDLINNGKTPAWITSAGSAGKSTAKEQPLPTTPSYTEMKPFSEKGSLLSPTSTFTQGFLLTKERLDSVQDGQSQLFIFGYAKYRDAYGDSHIIRYCFEAQKSHDANHPYPLQFYVGGSDNYVDAD